MSYVVFYGRARLGTRRFGPVKGVCDMDEKLFFFDMRKEAE